MQKLIWMVIFGMAFLDVTSQSEEDQVRLPLNDYLIGTSYNYPDQILNAFQDSAYLFLTMGGGESRIFTPEGYAKGFGRNTPGEFNGRHGEITRLDIYNDVAYAEIEILIPAIDARFIDLILLKRFPYGWKIIGKTATRYNLDKPYEGPIKENVIEGLRQPWSMAFINEEQVLITELAGELLHLNLSTKEKKVISGFPDDLFQPLLLDNSKYPEGTYPRDADGRTVRFNAGILEVILDPDFSQNALIYISYVSQREDTYALKVIRAKLEDNSLQEITTLLNPGPYVPGLFHFGGGMTFGNDGNLYITVGERLFYEGLKEGLAIAQDVTDERGKIYRIRPDGSIPDDNPDFGSNAVEGLYATGIRAAQGITRRPGSDEIWFSEHGTVQGDEVNLLVAGANYGWPNVTSGRYRTESYEPAEIDGSTYTDPVHYWQQTVAPTGLKFYSGSEFPEWEGNLIVPGLSRGSLWRLSLDGLQVKQVEELFVDDRVRTRKVAISPQGKIYLLTDEDDGKIIEVKR